MNNLESMLPADTIKALDTVAKTRHARMAAYRLPIKPGRATFSALDPNEDGSGQPYKTSFVWGPNTNTTGVKTPEDLLMCAEATTIKFMPFTITSDGKIHNGGLMPDPIVKAQCKNCKLEFTMTQTAFFAIRRKDTAYCQACEKTVSPKKCRLLFNGVVEDHVDREMLKAMFDCQSYESKTPVHEFVPNVYGVFNKGNAPGSSAGWEYTAAEEELVRRYGVLGMEIRPLKFLQDLYTECVNNGRQYSWKKGIPNLRNLIVSANEINIGWFDNEELSQYPFNPENSRVNGFYCNLPLPGLKDSLV